MAASAPPAPAPSASVGVSAHFRELKQAANRLEATLGAVRVWGDLADPERVGQDPSTRIMPVLEYAVSLGKSVSGDDAPRKAILDTAKLPPATLPHVAMPLYVQTLADAVNDLVAISTAAVAMHTALKTTYDQAISQLPPGTPAAAQ